MRKVLVLLAVWVAMASTAAAQEFPKHILVKSESRFFQKLAVELDLGDYRRHPELKDMEKRWENELEQLRSHVAMVEYFENMGYVMEHYNIVRNHIDNRRDTMDHTHYFWFTLGEESRIPEVVETEEQESP